MSKKKTGFQKTSDSIYWGGAKKLNMLDEFFKEQSERYKRIKK